jgi:hypothetical protein
MSSMECVIINWQTSLVLTSGEASSKITAPRVSTWITLAAGSGEDMADGRWDVGRLEGVGGIKGRPFGCLWCKLKSSHWSNPIRNLRVILRLPVPQPTSILRTFETLPFDDYITPNSVGVGPRGHESLCSMIIILWTMWVGCYNYAVKLASNGSDHETTCFLFLPTNS